MHNDYAGCLDKQGWDNPNFYRKEIIEGQKQKDLDDDQFIRIVRDYLLDFKDLHISFRYTDKFNNHETEVGFSTRRYKDSLYILSAGKENRLKPGDKIIALDGKAIEDLVEIHQRQLMETEPERENWNTILPLYKTMEIKDVTGHEYHLDIKKFEKEIYQGLYTLKEISEGTLLLKVTDFLDQQAITQLVTENESSLSKSRNLIIDVRENKGGSDLAFFELLPFIFNGKQIDLNSFNQDKMLTNCTSRNVALRKKLLKQVAASIHDATTLNQINTIIGELESNRGRGFVELEFGKTEDSLVINTKPGPDNIVLLTDVYCGSSGDSFVEVCKNSSKVTVIGRPTLGLNDYANIAAKSWADKFELWYPTSKLSRVDEGVGVSGIGIKPDIYVPWTPRHIKEDVDLKRAINHLSLK
ncbi:S41 family peptidase [Sediminibacillus halophilus]|uniref:S41 family peptidase n=1 Tax=Sediminibacillus halophilus TaxID=482461 RepID=UPI001FDEE23B|nr:S41 family peptidase [Sediminibacillus halophilus]